MLMFVGEFCFYFVDFLRLFKWIVEGKVVGFLWTSKGYTVLMFIYVVVCIVFL